MKREVVRFERMSLPQEEFEKRYDELWDRNVSNCYNVELKCLICNKLVCHFDREGVNHAWVYAVCQECSDRVTPNKKVIR
jgi:hypothetical protein